MRELAVEVPTVKKKRRSGDAVLPLVNRYLIAVGIECFVDGDDRRYIDHLWYKDLIEHLRYIDKLTIACPSARRDPPKGAVRIDDDSAFAGIQFVDLPHPTSFGEAVLKLPLTIKLFWRAIGYSEIVHSAVAGWPIPLGWFAVPIAILRKKKIVIVVESAFWRLRREDLRDASFRARLRAGVSETINRWCVNHSDLSVFTQPEYKGALLTRDISRGHVISASWIDDERIISREEAADVWRLKVLHRPLQVLFAGRLVADKGILVLLEALKILDNNRIPIELDVLGDGELADACHLCSRQLKGSAAIRMLGTVPYDQLFQMLRRYHAVIVPSLSDEQPRIVFDAYSQAVPVIASDTDGLRICVENEKTGLLANVNSPTCLAAQLTRVHARVDELASMGMAALDVARRNTHRMMHERRRVLLLKLLSSEV
jgi:glycosyltransferase involved in cell wall biosynthesis